MYIKIFPYVNSWFSLHFSKNQRNPVAGRHKKPGFQQNQTTCQFILYIGDNWRRPFLYLIYNNICSYFYSDWIISLAIWDAILCLKKQTKQTSTKTKQQQQQQQNNLRVETFAVRDFMWKAI